ncbi:MAG: NDP-sugar synthase, partial [Methanomassiliicoccales archaeon]|nr:NDP-sugar synthase [Methanomassiliicoccales archaeon]
TDADLGALIEFHLEHGAEATMGLTEVEHPEQFGIVGVASDGRIERFKEKPRTEEVFSRVINAGTYVLERSILGMVPAGQKFDFSKNLYMDMLQQGRGLYASPLRGYWKDIGRPSDLYLANMDMAARKGVNGVVGAVPTGTDVVAPAFIGKGVSALSCQIHACAIGDGCSLGKGATLEGCLLLENVTVGQGAKLQGCILGEGCQIGPDAALTDCVLGDGTMAPPGSRAKDISLEPGDSI